MFTPFLPLLKFHLKMCQFLNCASCYFNPTSEQFAVSESNPGKNLRLRFILHLLLLAMSCNLFFMPRELGTKYQGTVFFLIFILMFIGMWCPSTSHARVELFNCLLTFEGNIVKGLTLFKKKSE